VTLTQDTTTTTSVDVTVQLSGSSYFVVTNSGDDQYFKFNDTGITASNITNVTAGGLISGTLPTLVGNQAGAAGGFSGDGTGPFNFGISCSPACAGGSSGPHFKEITFTITNTTLAALEVSNGITIFASDVAVGGVSANTGPIDAAVATPLPSAFMLFGTVLASGLGLSGWRKRRQRGPVSVLA
jgi:hypothetical protein